MDLLQGLAFSRPWLDSMYYSSLYLELLSAAEILDGQ